MILYPHCCSLMSESHIWRYLMFYLIQSQNKTGWNISLHIWTFLKKTQTEKPTSSRGRLLFPLTNRRSDGCSQPTKCFRQTRQKRRRDQTRTNMKSLKAAARKHPHDEHSTILSSHKNTTTENTEHERQPVFWTPRSNKYTVSCWRWRDGVRREEAWGGVRRQQSAVKLQTHESFVGEEMTIVMTTAAWRRRGGGYRPTAAGLYERPVHALDVLASLSFVCLFVCFSGKHPDLHTGHIFGRILFCYLHLCCLQMSFPPHLVL